MIAAREHGHPGQGAPILMVYQGSPTDLKQLSIERRLKAIAVQVQCPLARGKLYLSVMIGDASHKRQIVVDCQAKAAAVRRSDDKRVHEAYIEEVCCDSEYAVLCDYFRSFFAR